MSNRFAALQEETTKTAPVGRDSKTHEPRAPKYGRQYDRNSAAGERRFPAKQGTGKGNWGNPKETRVREETEEQKARREEREKEHADMIQKHQEYLNTVQGFDETLVSVVAQAPVEIVKTTTLPEDLAVFKKEDKKAEKKAPKAKNVVMF